MKWSILAVSLSLLGLTEAHIHSQKVRHIQSEDLTLNTWLSALFSSALVGVCGVFPLLVNRWVRLDSSCKDKLAFRAVLSFAVGGLLGDVFLHLLPEAYGASSDGGHCSGMRIGLWVLVGLLSFLVVEKAVRLTEKQCISSDAEENVDVQDHNRKNGKIVDNVTLIGSMNSNGSNSNGLSKRTLGSGTNGVASCHSQHQCSSPPIIHNIPPNTKWLDKDISGYLNLVANSTDNFTHGLAIAASYVASPAVGALTTLAILCHEIPHEIGDFAILLNSGFSLKEAAKAQMLTACGGLVGVVVGLTAEHMSNASSWLLPFTAGGFLYIALVSIVPDLLQCISLRGALIQLAFLGLGVFVMALVTIVEKKSCTYMPPHLVGS